MRTLIDIGEAELAALDRLARSSGASRGALIRKAVDDYLARNCRVSILNAFGLWGDGTEDGLVYQQRMRCEW